MLATMIAASRSNFDCGSLGSRFSTLKVATDSSSGPAATVDSGVTPSWTAASGVVASSMKTPKL